MRSRARVCVCFACVCNTQHLFSPCGLCVQRPTLKATSPLRAHSCRFTRSFGHYPSRNTIGHLPLVKSGRLTFDLLLHNLMDGRKRVIGSYGCNVHAAARWLATAGIIHDALPIRRVAPCTSCRSPSRCQRCGSETWQVDIFLRWRRDLLAPWRPSTRFIDPGVARH